MEDEKECYECCPLFLGFSQVGLKRKLFNVALFCFCHVGLERKGFLIWLALIKRDIGQGPLSVLFLPSLVLLQHNTSEGEFPRLVQALCHETAKMRIKTNLVRKTCFGNDEVQNPLQIPKSVLRHPSSWNFGAILQTAML